MKLILFDIDGTLLDSGGAGTRSLNLAYEELFSIPDAFQGISMAGKTDIQILREGLVRHGLDSENGNIARLCDSYISHLRVQIENPKRRLKPAIAESVRTLSEMEGLRLGLLTGNIEAGARIKLGPFDLNRYFPSGAFGDDDEDRNGLLPIAVSRFESICEREIGFGDCIVIGDTPRDVECAKVHGAVAVAVATGPYPFEALMKTGADMVLRDMSEMECSALLNGGFKK